MRILVVGRYARGWWTYRVPWIIYHNALQASIFIDDSTSEYLSNYDLLILYGHNYRDRAKGEEILAKFVVDGGSVLVDTVNSPDSDTTLLGVKSYTTESFGPMSIKVMRKVSKFSFVDFTAFSPAEYEKGSWRHTAYKDVPIPVLSVDDKIVLGVKELGKGRVVYLGFNFFYHAFYHRNMEESRFLSRLIEWAPVAP